MQRRNAGILAAQILGSQDKVIFDKLVVFKEELKGKGDEEFRRN